MPSRFISDEIFFHFDQFTASDFNYFYFIVLIIQFYYSTVKALLLFY